MAEPADPEVIRLRAVVEQLAARVEDLDRELRAARAHVDLTMRGQLQCRACGCRRIAHALQIRDLNSDQRDELSLYQPSIWSSKKVGALEAYACTGCGFVEWYVKEPADLAEHEKYMRILDGGPEPGPYR